MYVTFQLAKIPILPFSRPKKSLERPAGPLVKVEIQEQTPGWPHAHFVNVCFVWSSQQAGEFIFH